MIHNGIETAAGRALAQSLLNALPFAMLFVSRWFVLENERWRRLWPVQEPAPRERNTWRFHHECCLRLAAEPESYHRMWCTLPTGGCSELVKRKDERIIRRHCLPLSPDEGPPQVANAFGLLLLDETPMGTTALARRFDGGDRLRLPLLWQALSRRECSVIELVIDGHTNREIAEILDIAEKTAERHRSSAMQKLRCRNLVDMVRSMAAMPVTTGGECEG